MSTAKHKGEGLQAYTANGLRYGPVVYLTRQGRWSPQYDQAWISDDDGEIARMAALAAQAEKDNLIVGAYPIDIDAQDGLPVRYRERFRLKGPTFDPGQPQHKDVLNSGQHRV